MKFVSALRFAALGGALVLVTGIARPDGDLDLAKALQDSFSRSSSPVMVRVISNTTRAALDYLTHDKNPLLHYPAIEGLTEPADIPRMNEMTFGGALIAESIRDRLDETPLTPLEIAHPLAWEAMGKLLMEWDYDAAVGLLRANLRVTNQRWGNADLIRPLQQITTAYLHGNELWVKVEFRPELAWVPADDEDGDGYRELYARLAPGAYTSAALDYLRADYMTQPLNSEDMKTYFFELTSDWYQALQTITLEPEESRPWPNADTEPEIRELLGDKSFGNPFVVVRGRPYGQVIYNVFVLGPAPRAEQTKWSAELERWGGNWEAWRDLLGPFQADVRRQLTARPADLRGLIGKDDWLFFRGDLEYLLSGDLRDQPDRRDPYPAIIDFSQQLTARGIDVLLVVIPTKAEIYPEKLSDEAPPGGKPYVAPYCRKLLGELEAAGVGVVDLLPVFVEARDGDEPLYMAQDTHWTNRGVRLAASVIAQTVKRRPVFSQLPVGSVDYSTRDVQCTRLGDICAMLTDEERISYRPAKLDAVQVISPDGQPYVDDPQSPLVMLGDSFTGVFQLEDCKHAGLSAHLALELGMPVDLIMAQGSGPRIRGQFARRGHDAVTAKKTVIWTVVSRDLYNYWAPWDPIKVP